MYAKEIIRYRIIENTKDVSYKYKIIIIKNTNNVVNRYNKKTDKEYNKCSQKA